MKLSIINTDGAVKGHIDFDTQEEIRPNLIKRAVLALRSKSRQPYGNDPRAGLKHATRVRKRRRVYRGSYGQGISRVPRKILSRSGRRIYWTGAEAPGTKGGRRAHPPKVQKIWAQKINKKENRKAINSAISATLNRELVEQRGHIIPKEYPLVLDNDWEQLTKTKDLRNAFNKLGFAEEFMRGSNGGKTLLIVSLNKEFLKAAKNLPGVDIATPQELNAQLLAPGTHPGRATLFTFNTLQAMKGQPAVKTPTKKTTTKKEAKK